MKIKKMAVLGLVLSLGLQQSCEVSSERDDVVAKVNSRVISMRDYQQALGKVSQFPIKNYEKSENRMDLLRDMIKEELLFQEALKAKTYERSYEVKKAMVREYLKERYSSKLSTVSKEEVETFFNRNIDVFEKVKASHILIAAEGESGRSYEEAYKKIGEIKEDYLKNPGLERFAELAKQVSEDQGTKNFGGDLGFFNRKTMVKEFTETSFNLGKVGDVSDLIKTQFGYHLIVLTGDQRGLARVEKEIRGYLLKEKNKKAMAQELAELQSSAKITTYQDAVKKITQATEENVQ